ncbi:MAG: ABC transporter ATP-binding protein [Planctomycetes bacterium]|nr:ABC transporter ATP-binding protein [Planctomycetota bacterium]
MKNKDEAREALISLDRVALGYNGSKVLDEVDLVVREGDFLGLVGPNGAGKTTLLRGLIGLLKPMNGRIRIGGPRQGKSGEVLGYVPQIQNLDPIYPLTVRETVRMGGYKRLSPIKPAGREENRFLEECLDEVGMQHTVGRLFSTLSSGQKQRVLIARALYSRSQVLLLDEPTSGADQAAEQKVMALLKRLNQEGQTILLVCHELDAVQKAVKEILWVSRGRVLRDSPARLLSQALLHEMYDDER